MIASFIIPAYNAEQTILRCLNSIYSLPLNKESFEIIVIDDHSTDRTIDVIEQFMTDHPELSLLRQEKNHRQGAARNRGMRIAKSDCICFVDSDDEVDDGIVVAINQLLEAQLDMVAVGHMWLQSDGSIKKKEPPFFQEGQIFSGIDFQNKNPYWCSGPCCYVYNSEFLKRVSYPFAEDVFYEDADFVIMHLYKAKRMGYSMPCGYRVHMNPFSTTRAVGYKNFSDYFLMGVRTLSLHAKMLKDLSRQGNHTPQMESFVESVLEGACYAIWYSFAKIYRLKSIKQVFLLFRRIDSMAERSALLKDPRIRQYYWNWWTALCLRIPKIGS